MKRRLFVIALCLTLLFAMGSPAFAADGDTPVSEQPPVVDEAELTELLTPDDPEESDVPQQEPDAQQAQEETGEPAQSDDGQSQAETPAISGPDILVNGLSIAAQASAQVYAQTTYISLRAVTTALYPDAQVSWAEGGAQVQAEGLSLSAKPGNPYLVANDRYLYIPSGILVESGVTLVPVRTLARALGASVYWDAATGNIQITAESGPIQSGESFYKSDAVYWLSRIINAESGSQPLVGKVAVGTVILNRVSSTLFPDTIYDVIFDCRGGSYQFSPARSGSIHKDPNTQSIIAAKLCLDGAREAGCSLFFNATGQSCWASRNRTLVTTIGGHSFYS